MTPLEQRLYRLGYGISRNVVDSLGRRWPYRTGPIASGGPIGYFKTLAEIERYAAEVEQVRAWQQEPA